MFQYCGVNSDPFNHKLMKYSSDTSADDFHTKLVPLTYRFKRLRDLPKDERNSPRIQKWLKRMKSKINWLHIKKGDTGKFVNGNCHFDEAAGDEYYSPKTWLGSHLRKYNTNIEGVIDGISSAIKKSVLRRDVTVYRGINPDNINRGVNPDNIGQPKDIHAGFKSTTTDIHKARNYTQVLECKVGMTVSFPPESLGGPNQNGGPRRGRIVAFVDKNGKSITDAEGNRLADGVSAKGRKDVSKYMIKIEGQPEHVILRNYEFDLPTGPNAYILKINLPKGMNAYWHPMENQYVLDENVRFNHAARA